MILRLLLALLLVLPAGLSAGQHQSCEPTVTTAVLDSGSAPHHEGGEGHHASHGSSSGDLNLAAAPADGCDGCDLACKVTCAAVALPLGIQQSASPPSAANVSGFIVAGLLNPHPLALLRPPAHIPA